LADLQTTLGREHRGRLPALPVVTLLCLVFLALLAVVQVAHVHSVDTDADHCPLCVVMHSAAPVDTATPAIVLVQVNSPTPVFEANTVSRPWHPTLFTRPPPTSCLG
jgi:hypothetical protein